MHRIVFIPNVVDEINETMTAAFMQNPRLNLTLYQDYLRRHKTLAALIGFVLS